MPRYLANLARARDALDYSLYWTDPTPGTTSSETTPSDTRTGLDRMNWPIAMLALPCWPSGAGLRSLRTATTRRHSKQSRQPGGPRRMVGAACHRPDRFPLAHREQVVRPGGRDVLRHLGGADHVWRCQLPTMWPPLLLVELVANLGQLVFAILMLVLFFQRRTCFPKLMIGFYIASAVLQGADVMMSSLLPAIPVTAKDYSTLVRVVISSIIWSAYLLRSQRVKATFVRRYREADGTGAGTVGA